MSRVVGQNSLTPQGNDNLNFRLARDQVVPLETSVNCYACRLQASIFFSFFPIFEFGVIAKRDYKIVSFVSH